MTGCGPLDRLSDESSLAVRLVFCKISSSVAVPVVWTLLVICAGLVVVTIYSGRTPGGTHLAHGHHCASAGYQDPSWLEDGLSQ